jgi:tetratricopeptide (TPR) repeat protein
MSDFGRFHWIALRAIIAGVCLLGIWNSWKLARADYLSQRDTVEALRSAILLAPDDSEYYMRLAKLDEGHARELLATSLRLDRYNAQANIELGLLEEADGDFGPAEKLFLNAFDVDRTYMSRWSLANFYLRRDNIPAFWLWARKATEMPASDDIGALFELCWRVSPDPKQIERNILNDNPDVVRQYLAFLLEKNQLHESAGVSSRLMRDGAPETDRPLLLSVVNRLVAVNDTGQATALWNELIQQHWVVAETTWPNNANFARDPEPASFDWSLPSYRGLHSWTGPAGLETEFTGDEPEACTIAEQTMALLRGTYLLEYSYRTADIPPNTGIRWQIVDAKSGIILAESSDLSSGTPQSGALAFSVGPDSPLLRLRLAYQRALGTTRISGTLVIPSVGVKARPSA